MDRDLLQKWIKNPEKMDRNSHRELKKLTEDYPYFQTAHLLLLKNLHDNQSIRFKEELKNSAPNISDRRQLFLLLHNKIQIDSLTTTKEEKEDIAKPILKNSENNEESIKLSKKSDDLFDLSDEIEIAGDHHLEHTNSTILPTDDILELSDPKEKYESATATANYLLPKDKVSPIEYGGSLYTLSEKLETPKNFNKKANLSFNKWIDIVGKEKSSMHGENKQSSSSPQQTKENPNKLIDQFIKNEPRISRNVKTAEKQEDISVDSIRENDGFISETLASIYVKQKLFNKAISVYEKLVLKNPEKKLYFANQIKKIKKLKNSN